jgi:hypothetical protein
MARTAADSLAHRLPPEQISDFLVVVMFSEFCALLVQLNGSLQSLIVGLCKATARILKLPLKFYNR